MRRVLVVEALDDGFVVRTAGDVGQHARSLETVRELAAFLRWWAHAPAADPRASATFPMLEALAAADRRLSGPTPALEPRQSDSDRLHATESIVRQGPLVAADRPRTPAEDPDQEQQPTTVVMIPDPKKPKWARPRLEGDQSRGSPAGRPA